jgi:hypothetical protein
MSTSLRQYTNQARVQSVSNDPDLAVTDYAINLAEEMIDAYCADYIRPSTSARFYDTDSYVDALFTGNTVTLTSQDSLETNYLKYCVVETYEDGNIYPILNSHNLTLTLDNADSETGTKQVKIYQLSKFPRVGDTVIKDNTEVLKTIPQAIRQASSYQAWFIINRPDLFENSTEISLYNSESIGRGGQYSYTGGSPEQMQFLLQKDTVLSRLLSPEAKILLQKYKIQNLM